jgi:transposase
MQEHLIIELLGIKEKHVELWDFQLVDGEYHVWLQTKQRKQKCPQCQAKTKRVHGYRTQTIQGRLIEDKPVKIHLKKRRYLCTSCHHTFYEKLSFVGRYQRHTHSLEQQVMTYVGEHSFTAAGKMVGMSTNRVLRLFDKRLVRTNRVLPEVIAIDEFKGDAGKEKFQTIIVDVRHKKIMDILPDRRCKTIENYFKQCDTGRVQVVVMDLSKRFKDSVRRVLGNPLIVADRFHYMRQGYWALDKVRRETQRELKKEDRILCKRSKELLWKSPFKLTDEQKQKIEELLKDKPILRKAYELKNQLDEWFKKSNERTAKTGLEEWFQLVEKSNIDSFQSVVKTFQRWKTEILNSFVYPYSNGYIEGVNNTTKVIKRNSYGIKNFDRFRKKILWRQMIREVSD